MIKPLSKKAGKLPKLFKAAATILKEVRENSGNAKSLVYDNKYKHYNTAALLALVCESNNNWNILEKIIEKTDIFKNNPKLNPWVGRVLITQIIRRKDCKSECLPLLYVKKYANAILELVSGDLSKSRGNELRYIRVNTLKTDVKTVIETFTNLEGWTLLPKCKTYKDHLKVIEEQLLPKSMVFIQDFHIPEVLVFPSGHGSYFYNIAMKELIPQNKASCLDAFLLNPKKNSVILDMCAAPGMKTSHLAAKMENTGKIYAVEKDPVRFATLQKVIKENGVTNVTTINKDVTQVDSEMCPDVDYIILDPSCSGSGLREDEVDDSRLNKLQFMQIALLKHALTKFPRVKRVVYSTCSLKTEENEQVIKACLKAFKKDFRLMDLKTKLPHWISFGGDKYKFGSKCIYACPNVDFTIGFFIAIFERKPVVSVTKNDKKKKHGKKVKKSRVSIDNDEETEFVPKPKGKRVKNRKSEEHNAEHTAIKKKRKKVDYDDMVETKSVQNNKIKKKKSEDTMSAKVEETSQEIDFISKIKKKKTRPSINEVINTNQNGVDFNENIKVNKIKNKIGGKKRKPTGVVNDEENEKHSLNQDKKSVPSVTSNLIKKRKQSEESNEEHSEIKKKKNTISKASIDDEKIVKTKGTQNNKRKKKKLCGIQS